MENLIQQLIEAFNRRDLEAMAGLLHRDAATELVGSPFPPERGADAIRDGSFLHMLEGGAPLVAGPASEADPVLITLTRRSDGTLDTAIRLELGDEGIALLRYHTLWHDRAFLEALAARLGLALADDA